MAGCYREEETMDKEKGFDISLADSQATQAQRVKPEDFDIEEYAEYEQSLLEGNSRFFAADSGLQVYRRMRGEGVYYDKCREHADSLELQLGVLKKSIGYKADIANFLEPWYGIGYIASSFGADYIWEEGQAPAVEPIFGAAEDILKADFVPIHQSPAGKIILERIEYFLEKTKGKIPMSYCDVQAPVNMFSYLMPMSDFCMDLIDEPDTVKEVANLIGDLLIEFLRIQKDLIGDALAKPGHGFASSRVFEGVGESTDNVVMFSEAQYREVFQPVHERLGDEFGGVVFHSCGDWSNKLQMVADFRNTLTVDGAFSPQTDPIFNPPENFEKILRGSGIILNARCVGTSAEVLPYFRKLINKDMKVIAVTYCADEADQAKLYDELHSIFNNS